MSTPEELWRDFVGASPWSLLAFVTLSFVSHAATSWFRSSSRRVRLEELKLRCEALNQLSSANSVISSKHDPLIGDELAKCLSELRAFPTVQQTRKDFFEEIRNWLPAFAICFTIGIAVYVGLRLFADAVWSLWWTVFLLIIVRSCAKWSEETRRIDGSYDWDDRLKFLGAMGGWMLALLVDLGMFFFAGK